MGTTMTQEQLQRIKQEHQELVAAKQQEFSDEGKHPFSPPQDYEGHGPGVVPQEYYDRLREPNDPDFVPPIDLVEGANDVR